MNERQFRVSNAKADRLRRSLVELEDNFKAGRFSGSARFARAEVDGLRSLLEEVEGEIADYEALRSGKVDPIDVNAVAQLPIRLIRARIAIGLSQRQLGERLGVAEQQIQRYESTSYATASIAKLIEIASALEEARRH